MAFQAPCSVSTKRFSPSAIDVIRNPSQSVNRRRTHRCHLAPYACTSNPAESTSSSTESVTSSENTEPYNILEPPPNTFYQAITQAQTAVNAALAKNERLLEIEFPPLPTSELESPSVGAYEVSDANLRLALDFAQRYADEGKNVVLSFPDRIERDRVEDDYGGSGRDNIRLACLRDSRPGFLIELIWTRPEIELAVREEDDIFIVLGASCQELPDVEKLVDAAGDRPVILFNLKLDTLRGDLGLPAFPRKDLHYRFLSKVLPVYYLRTRTYSRSMLRPPYIVNYSGALFKVYPGPYQVLLDTSAGSYRRLETMTERPPLGAVRDMLTDGMDIGDGSKSKGKDEKSFMYRGYKSRTWWEDDRSKAVSNNWRK